MEVLAARERLDRAQAAVVLVAYDEPSLLTKKLLRDLAIPFPLLIDRTRDTYRAWGLGRMTWRHLLPLPMLVWRYVKLVARGHELLGRSPDMLQLGGDFVVDPDGRMAYAHRLRHNGDRPPVEDLIAAIERVARRG